MLIDVHRKYRKAEYTIGILSIDGTVICNTLEDTDRELTKYTNDAAIAAVKVKGKTAIPTGKYNVIMSYSPRFKRQMPLVCDVKGFSGIRIHSGNTAADTEGCILCGKNTEVGKVTNSRYWTDKVYEYIQKALKSKQSVKINIHW